MLEDSRKWVADSLAQLHLHAGQLAVFLVANIKDVTVVQDDYLGFSVQNDYMTERVIREIVQSLRDIGSYVELFIGEDAFIQAILSGAVERVDRPRKLVFNLAQSGTGPARKSLIPCFCNLHALPYCNSDGHVVALLRHKYHSTSILRDHGLSVPRTWLFQQDGEWLNGDRPPDGLKVIVKPTYEAACIGLSRDCVRPSDAELDVFARARAKLMRQPLTVQECQTRLHRWPWVSASAVAGIWEMTSWTTTPSQIGATTSSTFPKSARRQPTRCVGLQNGRRGSSASEAMAGSISG